MCTERRIYKLKNPIVSITILHSEWKSRTPFSKRFLTLINLSSPTKSSLAAFLNNQIPRF